MLQRSLLAVVVRPERFELPTPWFEAKYSIQMSYGRSDECLLRVLKHNLPWGAAGMAQ